MTAALFVVDAAVAAGAHPGDEVSLTGPEGHHAVGVKRVVVGELVDLSDGLGTVLRTRVAAVPGRDALVAQVLAVERIPAPQPRLVVVQGLPKGDRGELAVEALTEVGADVIVPWAAQRCVVRWTGEKAERGRARWEAVASAAAKQSRRAWFPQVPALATSGDVVALLGRAARGIVLHEAAERPLARAGWPTGGDVVLVVGPEGGIAPDEVEAFTAAGAGLARMGRSVMRASTAGTAAAAVVLAATDRWA
jgi:16S rRNA (uracil1498-N3)-methyltransferase